MLRRQKVCTWRDFLSGQNFLHQLSYALSAKRLPYNPNNPRFLFISFHPVPKSLQIGIISFAKSVNCLNWSVAEVASVRVMLSEQILMQEDCVVGRTKLVTCSLIELLSQLIFLVYQDAD